MLPLLSCSQIWKQEVPDRNFDSHENICSKIISSLQLQLHLAHALRSILHRACQFNSRLTGWCWRGCAWHAGTASWTKAFSPSSAALELSVGPTCSLKFDKFLVYNSRKSEYDSILYYVSTLPWFTFLIWSVGNIVHANIIWISKLVPVLTGNTEQALDNLKGRWKNPAF